MASNPTYLYLSRGRFHFEYHKPIISQVRGAAGESWYRFEVKVTLRHIVMPIWSQNDTYAWIKITADTVTYRPIYNGIDQNCGDIVKHYEFITLDKNIDKISAIMTDILKILAVTTDILKIPVVTIIV